MLARRGLGGPAGSPVLASLTVLAVAAAVLVASPAGAQTPHAKAASPKPALAAPKTPADDQLDAATAQPMDGKPILLAPGKKVSTAFPLDRTFVAQSFKDQVFRNDRPSFQVSSSFRASGFASCNNWSATISARRDQRFIVGPMAVTKRQCDAKLMHNEQVYLFVLQNAQTWFYDGRLLTLTSPLGVLTLEPAV